MNANAKQKLDQIFKSHDQHIVPANTILYEPGNNIKEVCYITDGLTKQFVLSPKGEEVIIHIFQPPVIIPLMILFAGKPSLVSVETLEETKFYKASAAEVYDQITNDIDIMHDLTIRFAGAIYGLSERVISLTTTQQKQQLQQVLRYLAKKNNKPNKNSWHQLPSITHGQLASWLGTARETVSRLVKQLESEEIVRTQGKKIWVKA